MAGRKGRAGERITLAEALSLVGMAALALGRIVPAWRIGRVGEAVFDVILLSSLVLIPRVAIRIVRFAGAFKVGSRGLDST